MKLAVVLDAPIGGLGDGLLFSTLPELYARSGYEVYVGHVATRNPEVNDLLYNRNPFIRYGEDVPAHAQRIGITHERSFFFAARRFNNPIQCIEFLHGFDEDRRRKVGMTGRGDRPKIYYSVAPHPEWQNRIICDPTSISQSFPRHVFERFVKRLEFDEEIFIVKSPHQGANGQETMAQYPTVQAGDIYEYINLIASCKYFVCTESGSQSLAAAVRRDGIFALCTTMTYNSKFYIWPGVNYTVTGELSSDYLWNDSTAENVGVR